MDSIVNIIFRTFLALGVLLILAKIMGRRSVAQLTLYDYVLGLVFGNIGASIAVDRSIGVTEGIVSLLACTAWILVVNQVMLHSAPARKFVDPEPTMVIYKGCILEDNLRKSYYTINSVLEMLRERDIFDPGTVELAVIESDGQLSVLTGKAGQDPKGDSEPDAKTNDISEFTLHMAGRALIIDGKITDRVSEHGGISKNWLLGQLERRNIALQDVMVALITPERALYIDKKEDDLSFLQ